MRSWVTKSESDTDRVRVRVNEKGLETGQYEVYQGGKLISSGRYAPKDWNYAHPKRRRTQKVANATWKYALVATAAVALAELASKLA